MQDEAQSQIERITSEKELWENIELSLNKKNEELEKRAATLTA
jgi:single-stranded DNA-specific DHH superfamily exonuclease